MNGRLIKVTRAIALAAVAAIIFCQHSRRQLTRPARTAAGRLERRRGHCRGHRREPGPRHRPRPGRSRGQRLPSSAPANYSCCSSGQNRTAAGGTPPAPPRARLRRLRSGPCHLRQPRASAGADGPGMARRGPQPASDSPRTQRRPPQDQADHRPGRSRRGDHERLRQVTGKSCRWWMSYSSVKARPGPRQPGYARISAGPPRRRRRPARQGHPEPARRRGPALRPALFVQG